MEIILNGQRKNIPTESNLKEIIAKSCRNPRHAIVELNGQIIKSEAWAKKMLHDGDTLELVNFVGGG